MDIVALVDADSIAYMGGYCDNEAFMRQCIDSKLANIRNVTKCTKLEIWLEEWRQPKRLFRGFMFKLSNDNVKHEGYKGNRYSTNKPPLLVEARQYLLTRWNAKTTVIYESEDVVIRRAYEEEAKGNFAIVCHIDKDLRHHALQFYNYNTDKLFSLTPEESMLGLYRQVCSGDSTDNIPGIPGIGPVKAKEAICKPETALVDTVLLYQKNDLPYEYFIEQFNLIYIRKEAHTKPILPLTKEEWKCLEY